MGKTGPFTTAFGPKTSVSSSSFMPVSCSTPATSFTTTRVTTTPTTTRVTTTTTSPVTTTPVSSTTTSTCSYQAVTTSSPYAPAQKSTQSVSVKTGPFTT